MTVTVRVVDELLIWRHDCGTGPEVEGPLPVPAGEAHWSWAADGTPAGLIDVGWLIACPAPDCTAAGFWHGGWQPA